MLQMRPRYPNRILASSAHQNCGRIDNRHADLPSRPAADLGSIPKRQTMKTYAVAITAPSRNRKPIRRSPIRHKPRKRQPGDNPAYCAFVRTFGCIVCCGGRFLRIWHAWDGVTGTRYQKSPTECAHVGAKGLSQKCPDCESLPLCALEHHRVGPEAHHVLGKRFWGFHGLDRMGLIRELQDLFRLNGGSLQTSGGKSA
jgi:hypothetical protein